MQRFQNILYVSDGMSDETEVLKQALSLARSNHAALHVLVMAPSFPEALKSYKDRFEMSLVEGVSSSIEKIKADLRADGDELPVTIDVEAGKTPAVRIVRRVLRAAHDLVVKQEEAGGSMGFRALDMQLLRQCPCPLWLSRPIARPPADICVAVAVDPSFEEPVGHDLALELLRLARALTDTYDGKLNVISCWDYEFENYLRHQPWLRVSRDEVDEIVATTEREHRSSLDALIGESGIGGEIRVHNTRGRPDRRIPDLVEEFGVDILVMGTVARTGIPGFVIGNTAENVLETLKCSIVAMKPNGFVSPVKAY